MQCLEHHMGDLRVQSQQQDRAVPVFVSNCGGFSCTTITHTHTDAIQGAHTKELTQIVAEARSQFQNDE